MASFNSVTLLGNLTRDPELRYTPKGTAVCNFGLAVNRKWKNEAGEAQEEVTFLDLTTFGRTAEVASQYLRKGDPGLFSGRLKQERWEDKQTNQQRSKVIVIVETLQLLGQRREEGEPRQGTPPPPIDRPRQQRAVPTAQPEEGGHGQDSDSDVPF